MQAILLIPDGFELPEADKDKSLQFLGHLIEAIPAVAAKDLAEEALTREKSGNTGIGLGVACPHVRSQDDGDLLCAVGWSPAGMEYGSKDGTKVHLVVMYYIPDSQKTTYLREVSALAGAIKREGGIQAIAKAADIAPPDQQIAELLAKILIEGDGGGHAVRFKRRIRRRLRR